MNDKVYCKNCKHFPPIQAWIGPIQDCQNPKLFKIEHSPVFGPVSKQDYVEIGKYSKCRVDVEYSPIYLCLNRYCTCELYESSFWYKIKKFLRLQK